MNVSWLPVNFERPAFLALAILLPVVWWLSRSSLAGLGRSRGLLVIALRTAVLALLILAAAEMQWVRTSDRVTVLYLVDQSLSIPAEKRRAIVAMVNRSMAENRRSDDRAGVIVFGRDASIEIPPFDETVAMAAAIESTLDPDYTNLAGAIQLALASFPEDAARRLVIVSDGNENVGQAVEEARAAVDAGVAIDSIAVKYGAGRDVAVEKLVVPPEARKGQPFDLRVVVDNTTTPTAGDAGIVRGKLIVSQRTDDQPIILSEQPVELRPGKQVFTLRQELDQPNFYSYEARFVPDDAADDAVAQNNRGTTFTNIRGSGRVLLIEDFENLGEHALLVERLRNANIEVTLRSSSQAFSNLPELQQFDTVVLGNVPREDFSDQQISMLVRNTQDLGCGLVMLGGPNSFGAGGWTNTELEKAMPVDFQVKSLKVMPKGALALVMHASEMADGNFWQKVVAKEAIKALGYEDYCGLIHWNGVEQWLWRGGMIRVADNRQGMLAQVDRMFPGDMPDFDPGLKLALAGFAGLKDAAVKHMIVISDGDPAPPSTGPGGVIQGFINLKVTVTSVAVGCHGPAESQVMKDLAAATGGKYYEVNNPRALPRIFQREARRVARPLIYEDRNGFAPRVQFASEILGDIRELPPITGYVMTTAKQNPLVELVITSPVPAGSADNLNPLLATWSYGLGRSVAFTTDVGFRWAKAWDTWPGYDKLFTQMIRWSMRPSTDAGKFTVATDVVDGEVRLVVTALDKDDEFLNFLDLSGAVLGPDLEPRALELEQTAPGRYVGRFDAADAGNYFLMLNPGPGMTPIRSGVSVPYSAEFRARGSNDVLLRNLASLAPQGMPRGVLLETELDGSDEESLIGWDPFRHDLPVATSSRDAWPELLFVAACLFVSDVAVRRISIDWMWIGGLAIAAWNKVRRHQQAAPETEHLDRLRSRKALVTQAIEQRRAAARIVPAADEPQHASARFETTTRGDAASLESELSQPKPIEPIKPKPAAPATKEEESYTERLLKAKKRVWEDRDKK